VFDEYSPSRHYRGRARSKIAAFATIGRPNQNGQSKTALELIIEESVEAGAEEICVIVCPGTSDSYARAAGQHASRLTFIDQTNPRGYGDAIFRAKDFVGNEPFLHMVSDHVFISHKTRAAVLAKSSTLPTKKTVLSRPSKRPASIGYRSLEPLEGAQLAIVTTYTKSKRSSKNQHQLKPNKN